MIGRVARLYYEYSMTHAEIANLLGFSRVKVTRMLAEARRTGVVEIRVHSSETLFTDLEMALVKRFGLASAWVAPTFSERAQQLDALGTMGALALRGCVHPGATVAVGVSATVGRISHHVSDTEVADVTFVPATGSRLGSGEWIQPGESAQELAQAFGGTVCHLPAPMLASTQAAAELIRSEPDVARALQVASQADVIAFGVGGVVPGSGIIMDDTSPEKMAELRSLGAVGNISAGFFNAQGEVVDTSLDSRIIGLALSDLLSIPTRVALAGGPPKVAPLGGALAGGYINVLVTDRDTAQALLA